MSFPLSRYISTFLIGASLLLSTTGSVFAHQHKEHEHQAHNEHPAIMVMGGHARATFALAKTAAVYFTLHNHSSSDVTFTQIEVDSGVAEEAQIHTTVMQDDMMQMREVTKGVVIAANDKVTFESGGYHVMLLGLSKGLEEGAKVPLTLHFSDNQKVDIVLPVKKADSAAPHHHHDGHH